MLSPRSRSAGRPSCWSGRWPGADGRPTGPGCCCASPGCSSSAPRRPTPTCPRRSAPFGVLLGETPDRGRAARRPRLPVRPDAPAGSTGGWSSALYAAGAGAPAAGRAARPGPRGAAVRLLDGRRPRSWSWRPSGWPGGCAAYRPAPASGGCSAAVYGYGMALLLFIPFSARVLQPLLGFDAVDPVGDPGRRASRCCRSSSPPACSAAASPGPATSTSSPPGWGRGRTTRGRCATCSPTCSATRRSRCSSRGRSRAALVDVEGRTAALDRPPGRGRGPVLGADGVDAGVTLSYDRGPLRRPGPGRAGGPGGRRRAGARAAARRAAGRAGGAAGLAGAGGRGRPTCSAASSRRTCTTCCRAASPSPPCTRAGSASPRPTPRTRDGLRPAARRARRAHHRVPRRWCTA